MMHMNAHVCMNDLARGICVIKAYVCVCVCRPAGFKIVCVAYDAFALSCGTMHICALVYELLTMHNNSEKKVICHCGF